MAERPDKPALVLWALGPGDFTLPPGVSLVLDPAQKCSENPVLAPRPGQWDGTRCKVYGTVLWDEDQSRFRMWYSGGADYPEAMRRECGAPRRVGYAESDDGIHWHRNPLGLVEYQGSRDNNIVLPDGQAPNVIKQPEEPDPARRYVMLVEHGQRTEHNRMLFSADGLHWQGRLDNPMDPAAGGQVHEPFSVLYDPLDPDPTRRWKGYSLLHVTREGGYRGRAVGLYFSANLQRWEPYPEQPILDAATGLESEIHLPHVSRLHDTYLMLYDAMEPWHDTQTEIAVSRDGVRFTRLHNGVPVVPRGGPGDCDGAMICVSPRALFTHAGRIWWYYTASANNYQTGPRSGRAEPWYRYTCLAWWREDGLAHLEAEPGAPALETAAFRASETPPPAWLNVVATEPVAVALYAGERVLARGQVPPGDHLRAPVVWGKMAPGPGEGLHLRLTLPPGGRLYAVYVQGARRMPAETSGPGCEMPVQVPTVKRVGCQSCISPSWAFPCGKISGQPLTDGERAYVGSWDGAIYAVDLVTGKQIWAHQTANAVVAGGALLGERLFFGSRDGCVYALDRATGKELWRTGLAGGRSGVPTPNGPWVDCPPAVGLWRPDWGDAPDDLYRVFVGSHHRRLAALSPADGRLCWEYPSFNWILGRPVVSEYTVFFGGEDGYVHALDAASGALQWRYRVGGGLQYVPGVLPGSVSTKAVTASPLLHAGTLFVPAHDGFVHALDAASGQPRWMREIGHTLPGAACLVGDTLVVAANDGLVSGLDPAAGEVRWQWEAGQTVHADPLPDGAGGFLIVTALGTLVQLTGEGKVSAQVDLGCRLRATPCPAGNRLLVGTVEAGLICLPFPISS